MTINKFQTEWIVAHLLFPNSAQAREVYLFVVSQLAKKPEQLDISKKNINTLKVFSEVFKKTKVVQSGYSFSEFSQTEFKIWPGFYRKLSKDEILLLIAVVYLNLPLVEVAKLMKISLKQAGTKFIQTTHKVIPKPLGNQMGQYQFKYKTIHENRKSDYNLCDEALSAIFNLGKTDEVQFQDYLESDPRLHVIKYFEKLKSFKNELIKLNLQDYILPEIRSSNETEEKSKLRSFKNFTFFLPTAFVTISILILLFLRPQFIHNSFLVSQNKTEGFLSGALSQSEIENKKPEQISIEPTIKIGTTVKTQTAIVAEPKTIPGVASGGLYRGKLIVTDVQQVIGVVREKIINYGGKKAGEVELGWMKNESTSYFHFSFPEAKIADLENYLNQFGKVKLVFESHPRIMPKGTKRYILEIKQNE